jgi:hypothetical protein
MNLHTPKGASILGILTVKISKLPLGDLGTKCHLDVGLVERHRVYYKGEGGGFPQVLAVVSLVSLRLPVVCPSTESAPTMH